ncbi:MULTISPECIES: hypothetical protein [unclassified Neisseria]|uniref:hypothetical protein n=1 Tax=unclassified Neisseria TaxID=2623750 RepID=UPI001071A83F|nr:MULTISPECIES: hypothetical protein [unclassified Neisseria]MBF0802908.1 hypothetical protein [Neisseria sp. 19428wB4_WF04]TFU44442.1 hypothetical protein E4T99_00750 [Neisseria sp. WF04]
MSLKTYTAKTPLIIDDATGREVRIEAGEKVALTAEQYQDVAAHVEPVEAAAEDAPEETPAPPAADTPEETPEEPEQEEAKTARNRKQKAE